MNTYNYKYQVHNFNAKISYGKKEKNPITFR